MKYVKFIVILLALIIIPALCILWLKPVDQGEGGQGQKGAPEGTQSTQDGNVVKAKGGIKVTRNSVKGGVTDKLKKGEPQKITLVVQTSGRASDADWGLKGMGSFVLNTCVECESEILEKRETVQGNIRVVEKRTFTKARQDLRVFETDVKLALYETLPLKEAVALVGLVGKALTAFPATAAAGAPTMGAAMSVGAICKMVDGTSMKDTLSRYGVNVPKRFEDKINEFIAKEVKTDKLMRIEDVEGKAYRITYLQSAEGKPMDVEIKRFNADEQMSEQEILLLRRANALIDWQILKGGSHEIGSEWKVDSGDFECLFDPYVNGRYSGEVVVRREANDADGDWVLKVNPGFVNIVSDKNKSNTTGKVRIDEGSVKIDEPNCQVKAMQLVGMAGARNLNEHHMLFKAHVDGECSFRAILTSEPVEK